MPSGIYKRTAKHYAILKENAIKGWANPITRVKQSLAHQKPHNEIQKRANKECHLRPDVKQRIQHRLAVRPTLSERIFIPLLQLFNVEYTGDWSYLVGPGSPKDGTKNPDFVHKSSNKCVDIVTNIHGSALHGHEDVPQKLLTRIEHFHRYGHDLLILFGDDWKDIARLWQTLVNYFGFEPQDVDLAALSAEMWRIADEG